MSVSIQYCASSHREDCSLRSVPEIFKSETLIWFCMVDSVVNSRLLSRKSHNLSALFRDFGRRRMVVSYRRYGAKLSVTSARVKHLTLADGTDRLLLDPGKWNR